jgi:hypothetical protein
MENQKKKNPKGLEEGRYDYDFFNSHRNRKQIAGIRSTSQGLNQNGQGFPFFHLWEENQPRYSGET